MVSPNSRANVPPTDAAFWRELALRFLQGAEFRADCDPLVSPGGHGGSAHDAG